MPLSPSLSPCATLAPRNIQRCNYLGGPFTFCIEIAWEMESESNGTSWRRVKQR